MTTFLDGPAAGQTLQLKRAPIYLRVTEIIGKFDALDQLDDEPEPGETLTAYVLAEKPGAMHILVRGRCATGGGFWPVAKYKLTPDQPPQETLTRQRRMARVDQHATSTRLRMTSLSYIVDNGDGTDQATSSNPREGRVIGIQTRIAEHLCTHSDLSSPFFAVPPKPRDHSATSDAGTCDYMSMLHGCCQLPIGHGGAHVFRGEPRDQEAKP